MNLFSQKFFFNALLAVFVPLSVFATEHTVENQPQVIEKALTLDNCGVLKQKKSGYLYLDITNEFISELLPLIECEGEMVPPRFYTRRKGIGAHIGVMYANERIANEIWQVHELGHTYSFNVKELRSKKITRGGKMKKVWFLTLEAPTLERLRENYDLPNKIKGHDFHIMIGYQLPAAPNGDVEIFISHDDDLDEEIF